jgi:hypothetical protein
VLKFDACAIAIESGALNNFMFNNLSSTRLSKKNINKYSQTLNSKLVEVSKGR